MSPNKIPPELVACNPEFLAAVKNGKTQEFLKNWMQDESQFKRRAKWNGQHLKNSKKEWENRFLENGMLKK